MTYSLLIEIKSPRKSNGELISSAYIYFVTHTIDSQNPGGPINVKYEIPGERSRWIDWKGHGAGTLQDREARGPRRESK